MSDPIEDAVKKHMAAIGSAGGLARAAKMTDRAKGMSARKAANARWAKKKAKHEK